MKGVSQYTVLPGKKKGKESAATTEAVKSVKPRRAEFKKKWPKRKFPRSKAGWSKPDKNDLGTDGDGLGEAEAANGEVPAAVNGSESGENRDPNPCPTVNGECPGGSAAETAKEPGAAPLPASCGVDQLPTDHITKVNSLEGRSIHHSEGGVLPDAVHSEGGDNPQW